MRPAPGHGGPCIIVRTFIQGSYTITDEGRLCFQWESDKYVTMQDGCYHFKREDRKIHIYRVRNPDSPIGDVLQ